MTVTGGEAALREEHDALAARLSARRSIDHLRRAALVGFAGFLAVALGAKLSFDLYLSTSATRFRGSGRWAVAAFAVSLLLLLLAAAEAWRCRRLMRAENEAFARMQALRRTLELDP